jgi:hypothetical protein
MEYTRVKKLSIRLLEAVLVAAIVFFGIAYAWKHVREDMMASISHDITNQVRTQQYEVEIIRSEVKSILTTITVVVEKNLVIKTLIDSHRVNADACFQLAEIIPERCAKLNISVKGFLGLMRTESDYDTKCVFSGAKGICQVMDITQREAIGISKDYDWKDPVKNTITCLAYLEYMRGLPRFKNADEMKLFRGYNRGPFHSNLEDNLAMQYHRKIEYYKSQL